jgi:hypothetical protein
LSVKKVKKIYVMLVFQLLRSGTALFPSPSAINAHRVLSFGEKRCFGVESASFNMFNSQVKLLSVSYIEILDF